MVLLQTLIIKLLLSHIKESQPIRDLVTRHEALWEHHDKDHEHHEKEHDDRRRRGRPALRGHSMLADQMKLRLRG